MNISWCIEHFMIVLQSRTKCKMSQGKTLIHNWNVLLEEVWALKSIRKSGETLPVPCTRFAGKSAPTISNLHQKCMNGFCSYGKKLLKKTKNQELEALSPLGGPRFRYGASRRTPWGLRRTSLITHTSYKKCIFMTTVFWLFIKSLSRWNVKRHSEAQDNCHWKQRQC